MNTVWLLRDSDSDDPDTICGIFSSEQAARAAALAGGDDSGLLRVESFELDKAVGATWWGWKAPT